MMNGNKPFNFFDDSLKVISYCPTCNARHNPVEAKILAEKADAHLVYVKCRQCQSAVLAVVSVGDLGVTSIGLATDLSAEDVIKFKNHSAISCDDVIAAHKDLIQGEVLINQLN